MGALLLLTLALALGAEPSLADVRVMLQEGRIAEAAEVVAHQREHHDGERSVEEEVELLVLEGLVAQQQGDHRTALWAFREALRLQPERTSVNLYLAQSAFTLGDYRGALTALERGEGAGERLPAYFLLRSRSEVALGLHSRAFATLRRGQGLHPESAALLREEALLLLGLGLVEAARPPARAALDLEPGDRDTWLVLTAALRQAGDDDAALLLLEEAALRFPGDHDLLVFRAHAWAATGHPRVAARLFTQAQAQRPVYGLELAEQLRLAGRDREALVVNAELDDPAKKLPQRLALLVALERWDRAVALAGPLDELPAVPDATRYQLAWAAYQVGDAAVVAAQVDRVEDAWLREGVVELLADLEED